MNVSYVLLAVVLIAGSSIVHGIKEDAAYYMQTGKMAIAEAEAKFNWWNFNVNRAKNVILGIGDGMGISTVNAARIRQGQLRGENGEENFLSFEKFPFTGLVKTYSVDTQVGDSASTATAIMSGVKTNHRLVGVDSNVQHDNCYSMDASHHVKSMLQLSLDQGSYNCYSMDASHHVKSMLQLSLDQGKTVGIVTTDRITGATPAATYAHSPSRRWKDDADMYRWKAAGTPCKDLARQLIEDNPDINVILGAGIAEFSLDRRDGRNLIQEWVNKKSRDGAKYRKITTASELHTVDASNVDYLMGIFGTYGTDYRFPFVNQDRSYFPTLAQMTKKAIEILSKNDKGFFLLVEGALIDKAHHGGMAQIAVRETVEFDNAMATADCMTDDAQTLHVVTGDHSHTFTISGRPPRGNDIFGLVGEETYDHKTYTTLGYTHGYGYYGNNRLNIGEADLRNEQFVYSGGAYRKGPHGGEDVGVYAKGPQAHLLTGVHENSYIGHVMQYAACVGQYESYLDCRNSWHSVKSPSETIDVSKC